MKWILILATVVFYGVGCIWGLVWLHGRGGYPRRVIRFWLLAGFLTQTAVGILAWHELGRFPVTQQAESLWLLAWLLALAFLVIDATYGLATLAPLLLPLLVVLVSVGILLGHGRNPGRPAWTPVHVTAAVLGFAAFALAALSSVAYLLQERRLKRKSGELPGRFPSLETLDRINFYVLSLGWLLLTVGLGIGVYAAVATGQLGERWWDDSKVISALMVWVFFSGVGICRWVRSLAGRPIAWLTLVGFILVVVTVMGTDVLAPGVHAALGR